MRQSEKKNWRKKEKGLLNRYAEMTHPQIRADRQEASQREARVSASQQSIADVYCPHIKTWSVHLWVSVRRKWDDHETRPLAHATFILILFLTLTLMWDPGRLSIGLLCLQFIIACAQFSYWANWWPLLCAYVVHGSLFAYAQHGRQLRFGEQIWGYWCGSQYRGETKLYCM